MVKKKLEKNILSIRNYLVSLSQRHKDKSKNEKGEEKIYKIDERWDFVSVILLWFVDISVLSF